MATHILDAFLVTFGLDSKEFDDKEREVREGSKRLREESKKTFDGMERQGKQLGSSLKSVRNEVVGLGLAFMGARSITDMITGMATGAASADRLGNTMGMTTKQVWSWRQAMKGVGGGNGDADAALQSIQRLRMAFQMGQMDPGQAGVLSRLGVGGGDLRNGNPGDILRKLSAARERMDPQLFSGLLSQIGLSGPIAYFLTKGQSSVDQLLKQYEANGDQQEDLAKKAEELQVELADLNTKIQQELVPVLVRVADGLNKIMSYFPGSDPKKNNTPGQEVVHQGTWFGGLFTVYGGAQKAKGQGDQQGLADARKQSTPVGAGRTSGTRAERNNNPGNIVDGPFARAQPGYLGHDNLARGHVMARFATAEQGFQAMVKLLLGGAYRGAGRDTIWSILQKYAPAKGGNNTVAYAAAVERQTGIARNQRLTQAQTLLVARAMAKHEGFRGITVHNMTVQTKDAGSFPRDVRSQTRRHAVAKADQGVAP